MLTVAIDLTPLRPGGENGGVKHLILESLRWLKKHRGERFRFVHLTASITHAEVCAIARPVDRVVCVLKNSATLPVESEFPVRSQLAIPYDPARLDDWAVEVFYAPFGAVHHAGTRVPVLALVVDLLHRDFPQSLTTGDIESREKTFRELCARATRFQCNTRFVIGRLAECYGVPPDRCFTVYNLIQYRLPLVPTGPAPDFPGLAPEDECFYYPANFWVHKNHDTLIVAYACYREKALRAGLRPWKMVFTGHQCDRAKQIRIDGEACGAADGLVFLGHLSEAELVHLWNRTGAMVFPSLHEGFGIPPLEAMRFGVPVISGTDCSLPEVGGDACRFVNARKPGDLAEAMFQFASSAELRTEYAKRGIARLRELDWDTEMSRLADNLILTGEAPAPAGTTGPGGIHADGWFGAAATLPLPAGDAPVRLTIHAVGARPETRLSLHAGERPFGGFRLDQEPDGKPAVTLIPRGETLHLTVDETRRGPGADTRQLGARLLSVQVTDSAGTVTTLFAIQP